MSISIEFNHISKQYRLGLVSTKTLSHDLNRWWQTSVLHKEDPYLKIGSINDRSKAADSEYVWALKNIDFKVEQGDVVGIVGKNGAGKSTMLKILCGQQKPTAGNVSIPNDCRIGYLPQVMVLQDDTTVREEAQKAFADITKMKQRLDQMNQELAERTDYESEGYLALIEKYTTEHERYLMMGAESREA